MIVSRAQRAMRAINLFSGGSRTARPPQKLTGPDLRVEGEVTPFEIVQTWEDSINPPHGNGFGDSLTLTFPSTVQADSLMVMFAAATFRTLSQLNNPAGWTLVTGIDGAPLVGTAPLVGKMWWKTAAGGETSQTITTTNASGATQLSAVVAEVTGATTWTQDTLDTYNPAATGSSTFCGSTGTLAVRREFVFAAACHVVTRASPDAANLVEPGFEVIDLGVSQMIATTGYKATTRQTSLSPTVYHPSTGSCDTVGMVASWYGT